MTAVYAYSTTRRRIADLPEPIRTPLDALPAIRALLGDDAESEQLAVLVLDNALVSCRALGMLD
jgi:hypothetical protein